MNKVISCLSGQFDEINKPYPKCVVLMSTYNGERYVECQIESILSQEFVDVHLLIRDDGSSDKTLNILQIIRDAYPERVTIISGKNVGIHKSFADLIRNTKVERYVAFADQDDRWDKDKLITGINALEKNNASFYSSAARLVNQELIPLNETTACPEKSYYYMSANSKVLTPGTQGCTIVLKDDLFNQIRDRDYPDCYGHDTWLTIVAYLLSDCLYDDQPHMDYRQHNASWTGNRSNKIKQFFVRVKFFIRGLERYERLSKDILERYEDVLNEKDKDVLRCIAEKSHSIRGRVSALHKYKFGKYGIPENLMFKLYYIFS